MVVPPGRPDSPSRIRIAGTTENSVTISWEPGFDGGYNQTFVVTVSDQKTGSKIKDRTLESNRQQWYINGTTVGNLKPHTSYIIKVQAKNKAGLSSKAEEVFVKTRAIEEAVAEEELLPRVAVVTIVMIVVLVITVVAVFVACCCFRRRRKTPAWAASNRAAKSALSRNNSGKMATGSCSQSKYLWGVEFFSFFERFVKHEGMIKLCRRSPLMPLLEPTCFSVFRSVPFKKTLGEPDS